VKRAKTLDAVYVTYPVKDERIKRLVNRCYAQPIEWGNEYGKTDENDLVGRYLDAAKWSEADLIVRIPCDNPCIDPAYIDAAVDDYLRDPFIYYSNTTAECDGKMIDGIGAEVFSMSRLRWLDERTQGNAVWREHPHRYFEECGLLQLPQADYRLDVNTQADYAFIKGIYDHFGNNQFTTQQVVQHLTTQGVMA
jgi:spore coat polysaccharide biosynthesis protein SpsF (cytidylyltransferase family)